MIKVNKIKTLKDAKYFIDNFSEYETSIGEFTFKDDCLEQEGFTRILRPLDGENWKAFSFGNSWEDRSGKEFNYEKLALFIYRRRKNINAIIG